jgi:hypothetical protein
MAALGRSGLVDATNCLGTGVFAGNDSLTVVSQLLFIPNDALEKPLQGSRGDILIQRDRLGVLSLDAREQPSHVNSQQCSPPSPSETAGETRQELGEQFAKLCDILNRHGATLRGFFVKRFTTRKVASFSTSRQDR